MKLREKFLRARVARLCEKTEKRLKAAGVKSPDARAFFAQNAKSSLLAGLLAWLVIGLYAKSVAVGLFAMACVSVPMFVFLSFVAPERNAKRRAALVERDLPFALNDFAVELSLGAAFEKCVENVSRGNYGIVSAEFAKILVETGQKGKPMQRALFDLGNGFDSRGLKRACSQLAFAYNFGSAKDASSAIRRVSSEMLSRQRTEAKAFSAQLAMLSLVFVVASAIVPAMFQVFIVVGSAFLKMSFSPLQVLLVCAAGFPLLDICVFFFVKGRTPLFMQ